MTNEMTAAASYDELSGKVALITGASRGIGRAAALALASNGVALVLAARDADALERLAEEIRAAGGRALPRACDVARYDEVEAAVGTAVECFGQLDILVNNAGVIDPVARLADSDPMAWGRVVDINLKGVYHGMRAALPVMERQGAGVIVNLSSGAATNALEGWSHYCATKAAVLALTRCGHKEYGPSGVRVVGLSPGTVATEMQEMIRQSGVNPVSQLDWSVHIPPEWPARAICWLATEAARGHDGGDFSIKTEEGRRAVGLI